MGDSPENSPAIIIRGGEPWLMGYCWSFNFHATRLLLLRWILGVFWSSTTAYVWHAFWHLGDDQQYPGVFLQRVLVFSHREVSLRKRAGGDRALSLPHGLYYKYLSSYCNFLFDR